VGAIAFNPGADSPAHLFVSITSPPQGPPQGPPEHHLLGEDASRSTGALALVLEPRVPSLGRFIYAGLGADRLATPALAQSGLAPLALTPIHWYPATTSGSTWPASSATASN